MYNDGSLNVTNGELTITHGKTTFDDTHDENWTISTGGNYFFISNWALNNSIANSTDHIQDLLATATTITDFNDNINKVIGVDYEVKCVEKAKENAAESYEFYQIDSKNDASTVCWTYCDTEDGQYVPIPNTNGLTAYTVESAYADKYIKFMVFIYSFAIIIYQIR